MTQSVTLSDLGDVARKLTRAHDLATATAKIGLVDAARVIARDAARGLAVLACATASAADGDHASADAQLALARTHAERATREAGRFYSGRSTRALVAELLGVDA